MYAQCQKCGEQLLDDGLKESLTCLKCGNEIKSRAYDPLFYQQTIQSIQKGLLSPDFEMKKDRDIPQESAYQNLIIDPTKNAINFISLAAITCVVIILFLEIIMIIPSIYLVGTEMEDKTYLFNLEPENKQFLKEGNVSVELKQAFKNKNYTLSKDGKVYEIDDSNWEIEDENKKYLIEDSNEKLNIYQDKSKNPFFIPIPVPPFLVAPDISINGITLFVYYLSFVITILISFIWIIKKEAKKAYKIFDQSFINIRPPPKDIKNPLFLVPQLFITIMFFSFIYVIILYFFGINTDVPESLTDSDLWELIYGLTRASVYEELVVRLLFIGIPLLFIDYCRKRKKPLKNYFFGGGFELNISAVFLIVFSSVIFGLAHLPGWGAWKIIPTVVGGFAFGYLFLIKGIHTAIILHFIIDYLQIPLEFAERADSTIAINFYYALFLIMSVLILIAGITFFYHYSKTVIKFLIRGGNVKSSISNNSPQYPCPMCGSSISIKNGGFLCENCGFSKNRI